jgi:hypothetical protein
MKDARSVQPITTCRTLPDLERAHNNNLINADEYSTLFRRVRGTASPLELKIYTDRIEEYRLGRFYETHPRPL